MIICQLTILISFDQLRKANGTVSSHDDRVLYTIELKMKILILTLLGCKSFVDVVSYNVELQMIMRFLNR